MKIEKIDNVGKLVEVIDSCQGQVELVLDSGERLNLKEKDLQRSILKKVMGADGSIRNIELVAQNPADSMKLIDLMMAG
ncbi:MAG: polya polymerase [Lachnospiraceae bacterium]|nr:polya polymerase [Lachnospiraceae bacterium]